MAAADASLTPPSLDDDDDDSVREAWPKALGNNGAAEDTRETALTGDTPADDEAVEEFSDAMDRLLLFGYYCSILYYCYYHYY